MKCPTCNRESLTGQKCAMCLLATSNREFTNTLIEIMRPPRMDDWPNPYDPDSEFDSLLRDASK